MEEIRAAYRQLSMMYHPDKHQDPELREVHRNPESRHLPANTHMSPPAQAAQRLFPSLQRAYSVLSDPQQRDVYDLYGHAGLEAGSEVRRFPSRKP